MALIKSPQEIQILREGGKRLAQILGQVVALVRPGVSEIDLDQLAERLILEGGDIPAFKNYQPDGARRAFPATLCVSVNDAIVHGIPTDRLLREGDIVGLDLGLQHRGLFVDMATTIMVGQTSSEDQKLVEATAAALESGIRAAKAGAYIGDISAAIEQVARTFGYGIVRELGGHGVGHQIHEEPFVPNYGEPGSGPQLKEGMVLALEPMFNKGEDAIKLARDQFTYRTLDGQKSAHFEKTILITETGPEILTA